MPHLDPSTFINQITYLGVTFFFLYFLLCSKFLPKLSYIQKTRSIWENEIGYLNINIETRLLWLEEDKDSFLLYSIYIPILDYKFPILPFLKFNL